MKTLFLLRHAKSSWDDANLSDFERPLNSRGLAAARFIGELAYKRDIHPQLIVSSPAKRAKQTAVLVKEIAELSGQLRFDERIYEASPMTLFHVVGELEDTYTTALIVGHNPGMEDLVRVLTSERHSMPTAALASISLPIEHWSEIQPDQAKLNFLIRPKEEMKGDF